MAILIDIRQPDWMADTTLRDRLAKQLPGVEIQIHADGADRARVIMAVVVKLHPGVAASLPNLRLVQKLGAGVDGILSDPALHDGVRVTRLRPDTQAEEIAEYVLMHTLARQRNMTAHAAEAARGRWTNIAPREKAAMRVGVLGLGFIGLKVAAMLRAHGFPVSGWSRRPREIEDVRCHHDDAGLRAILGECDVIAAVLPSTPRTRGLMDGAHLAMMKPGAALINVGRGDLIDTPALIAALDAGRPGAAILDVFPIEPLPHDDPLWLHPRVTVTPHVSGWTVDSDFADLAENWRRLSAGQDLLHEIDRAAGY